MSGGKAVFVSEMYWPRARIRWGSVHRWVSDPREGSLVVGGLGRLSGCGK